MGHAVTAEKGAMDIALLERGMLQADELQFTLL